MAAAPIAYSCGDPRWIRSLCQAAVLRRETQDGRVTSASNSIKAFSRSQLDRLEPKSVKESDWEAKKFLRGGGVR